MNLIAPSRLGQPEIVPPDTPGPDIDPVPPPDIEPGYPPDVQPPDTPGPDIPAPGTPGPDIDPGGSPPEFSAMATHVLRKPCDSFAFV